jgi:hypothetical protein
MYIVGGGRGREIRGMAKIPLNDLQQSVNFLFREEFLYF